MNRSEVLAAIQLIFLDVFDIEEMAIDEKTTAMDIDEWDSLTHIQVVVALEKKFGIRFNSSEIQNWSNVGEIIDCILSKL